MPGGESNTAITSSFAKFARPRNTITCWISRKPCPRSGLRLQRRHVKVNGSELRFRFAGKSGRTWQLKVKSRRVAKIVRACQDLPGQELFQYYDENGDLKDVTSSDVNAYLREISGKDITAKDFRTWHGTVLAAVALSEIGLFDSETAHKKSVRAAVGQVASRLGNTATICRKCYIHPEILQAYATGELLLRIPPGPKTELGETRLAATESAVLSLLEKRLGRTLKDKLNDSVKAEKSRGRARRIGAPPQSEAAHL
jgi:DNA topoisomerase I